MSEPDRGGDAPLEHDGLPIIGYRRGEPIPDLNAMPEEERREALRPLSPFTRNLATGRVRTIEQAQKAIIKGLLISEDDVPRSRGVRGAPPPLPAGAPPARGAGRQISFRLGPDEHARLVEAAKLFAMRPATLARSLTIRGVDRALHEERRGR